ncbi:hypothetical protein D3C86_1922640 [compost metagenome]
MRSKGMVQRSSKAQLHLAWRYETIPSRDQKICFVHKADEAGPLRELRDVHHQQNDVMWVKAIQVVPCRV